jgi:hypothetical protein
MKSDSHVDAGLTTLLLCGPERLIIGQNFPLSVVSRLATAESGSQYITIVRQNISGNNRMKYCK